MKYYLTAKAPLPPKATLDKFAAAWKAATQCQCGAEKHGWTHSVWCAKHHSRHYVAPIVGEEK